MNNQAVNLYDWLICPRKGPTKLEGGIEMKRSSSPVCLVVTDMFDPKDPKAPDKMAAGENTGAVYEWQPHKGFALVPGSRMSGNNGIEVSRDGKWIYVAAWGNKMVVRLSRGGGAPARRLPVGFLADNLRWAPDGELTVAGQNVPAKLVFSCFQSHNPRCTQPWRIVNGIRRR